MASCPEAMRILEFEKKKKKTVEIWAWTKQVDFRSSPKPDQLFAAGCRTWWWSDGKVIIERKCVSLSLSPHVEKNLKLKKVIKSFVPEPILSVFGFLYEYEHL